jgi:hypothetical protein
VSRFLKSREKLRRTRNIAMDLPGTGHFKRQKRAESNWVGLATRLLRFPAQILLDLFQRR